MSFKIAQFQVKNEIKNDILKNISDKQLVLIKISKGIKNKNVSWKEENEFSIDGKMYDVVRKIDKGDSIYCYCINDEKEESLFANLDEHVKINLNNANSKNSNLKNILKIMMQEYLYDINYIDFVSFESNVVSFSYVNVKARKLFEDIITPPPNQFSNF
ncbi:MAG: hypothetical protein Q8880_03100 [Bacteroidota bacterium]|nr:hypothetical protein [Bacteroidota bacterium]